MAGEVRGHSDLYMCLGDFSWNWKVVPSSLCSALLIFNRKKELGLSTMSNKNPLQSIWNRDIGQFLFFVLWGFFPGGGRGQSRVSFSYLFNS